jgi:hypothetical protein
MDSLAEREGFEPPIRLPVCRISSAVHSTTLPPLHGRKGAVEPSYLAAVGEGHKRAARGRHETMDYLPVNTGLRFSMKAVRPST